MCKTRVRPWLSLGFVLFRCPITYLYVFISVLQCPFVFTPICFIGGSCIICCLYSFTYAYVQHDFNIILCLCRLTIKWRLPVVEQVLAPLPEHMNSPVLLWCLCVAQSSVLYLQFACLSFCFLYFLLWLLTNVYLKLNIETDLIKYLRVDNNTNVDI